MTWQSYLSEPKEKLWVRYVELTEDIAGRCEEIGAILAEEKRSRAQGYHNSESSSVSGQERDASLNATDDTAEYLRRRGELDALKEERDLIGRLLDPEWNNASPGS